jgi:ribonuclease P protein subunit RPR2
MKVSRTLRKGDVAMLELLAIAAKSAGKDATLMHSAVKDIFRLNSSMRVRIPLGEKRRLCKNCLSYLKPGVTSTTRVREGRVIITCTNCGNVKRLQFRK